YQRNCRLIDAFIEDRIFGTTLSVGDRAEHATGSVVSANYFQALGVRPILGRGFEAAEDAGRNAHPVAVISYQAWKDRYGGDPAIIGRTQMLNGRQHTIVGVAPKGFYGTFVAMGSSSGSRRRCRNDSPGTATSSRIAARAGSRASRGSSPG
ncbi:MAG TPA: ABC transporter permease, partial [Thermoanaerobaculia bacterium]|nr:ABC transporter permease [Thermoanaerobaculia bacterium]